ncbi:MAG TPA: isoprenylcysteine carboxylmethyltransferase family protein [Acidobacteriaceae bacterium]|nr:isoprenylcysteine carboxylmethyltransferase family protein [Acidobacteriaceae bacterium]
MSTQELLWTVLADAWVIGEIAVAVFTYTRSRRGNVQDRGTQLLLWFVIIASFWIDGWMHNYFPADMPGRHTVLRPLAIALLALGLAVRATAILTLGRAFSANVAIRASQTLQRSGLYRFVRHPSYTGIEIIFLAAGLHSRTWACLAVCFIPPTIAVLYRIHVEEAALRRAFGADYDDYARSTKRLIPGVY